MFASRLSRIDLAFLYNGRFQRRQRRIEKCQFGAALLIRPNRHIFSKTHRPTDSPRRTIRLLLPYFCHLKTNGSLTRDMRSACFRAALGIIRLFRIATRLLVLQMNTASTKWVKLDKFCEQTGFTRKSVYALIRNGRWMIAKHFTIRNRRYFINIVEYERWVERG